MADKRRRKSLSMFRHKHEHLAESSTPTGAHQEKVAEMQIHNGIEPDSTSPRIRPRMLQKTARASTFGSLRSLRTLDLDEKTALTRSDSKSSSLHGEAESIGSGKFGLLGHTVMHYGDVQSVVGNVFRKKSHFMVLTESHLIRFRSQNKAAEMFSVVPSSMSRTTSRISMANHSETPLAAYQDITHGIPLHNIVAVYKLDDGRPFFTIEISYVDEQARRSSAIQMYFSDPLEVQTWISAIRTTARIARDCHSKSFRQATAGYVIKVLEDERDFDPDHFHFFTAVRRAPTKSVGRASSDDLNKVSSSVCHLAIGLHKLHMIPLARSSNHALPASSNELENLVSHGIAAMTSLRIVDDEDSFQLSFKTPQWQPVKLQLASAEAFDIALWLRYACEYLRPEWLRQPFVYEGPSELDDRVPSPPPSLEDYASFDRTLMAYAAAYEVDPSRICYTIDHSCEDAPKFQLLLPSDDNPYTAPELMATLRSLRYNECFCTISFSGVNLCPLRYLYDVYATDIDSLTTRSGTPTGLALHHHDLPVLCQEIRALALKSRRLRRLDFASAFPLLSQMEEERDSCCILEALVPLCKKSLTNVDWIVMNSVLLADADVNFLVDAASERRCHLRALELGECGLSVHDIDVLLSTASAQESTMEVINIAGVQGRFSPELFHAQIGAFSHVRRLNLTRVQKTAGHEPLIPPEVLLTWRLEALYLSQTTINEQTVDSIARYLSSVKSEILRELHLNQCGLSGRDLAVFFRSMTRTSGQQRQLHVSASENRLKVGISNLSAALQQNHGPSSLTMRMLDFEKELQFRELIEALTCNNTLRSLDISRASLPYDASTETCEALKRMFAMNDTLEELDMSGEHAHLDATRFGIGLNIALRGLEKNHSLRSLRIEYQSLGLQGATTLAEVIQSNSTLQEIYCEHNDLNLQSFTVLVNALEYNTTLLHLPHMEQDREKSMERVRHEIETMEQSEVPRSPKTGIKKSLAGALSGRRLGHHRITSVSSAGSANQNLNMAVTALNMKWDQQIARSQKYLHRNHCLANGYAWEEESANPFLEDTKSRADNLSTSTNIAPEKSARSEALNVRKSSDREKPVFELGNG